MCTVRVIEGPQYGHKVVFKGHRPVGSLRKLATTEQRLVMGQLQWEATARRDETRSPRRPVVSASFDTMAEAIEWLVRR